MLFSSYEFVLLFLPVTVFLFFRIGRHSQEGAILCLVLCSLFYYGWWDYRYVPLIVSSAIVNYKLGKILIDAGYIRFRKPVLVLGISANLALLAYFKYLDFFIGNINTIFSTDHQLLKITLPIAISFFTFQQIAYLVDTYVGRAKETNFLHYCLFVMFFPQLIAGPIVHHKEMLPQFAIREIFTPNRKNLYMGLTLFTLGLAKKVLIADRIAQYANANFATAMATDITFFDAWGGALAYTFQLYFDFSGYGEMAIGAALMLNIRLPLNFDSPIKATSIIEFWQRWHITLTRFITAYIYTPIAVPLTRWCMARKLSSLAIFVLTVQVPILVTFLLAGLWHGANWTFVVFGALHGSYLVINHGWREFRKRILKRKASTSALAIWWCRGLTFMAAVFAFAFFRADSVSTALNMVEGMVGLNGFVIPSSISRAIPGMEWLVANLGITTASGIGEHFVFTYAWIVLATFICLYLPNSIQIVNYDPGRKTHIAAAIPLSWTPNRKWGIAIGLALSFSILALTRVGEFIYFQF